MTISILKWTCPRILGIRFVYARKADVFENQTGTIIPHESTIMIIMKRTIESFVEARLTECLRVWRTIGERERAFFRSVCRPIGRPEGENSCGLVNNGLTVIDLDRREPRSTRQ